MSKPEKMNNILSAVLQGVQAGGQMEANQQVQDIWSEFAPKDIANLVCYVHLRNSVLLVGVEGSAALSECVSFHKRRLWKSLSEPLKELGVVSMRFELA